MSTPTGTPETSARRATTTTAAAVAPETSTPKPSTAHPTAAKLYLNWALSTERQQGSFNGWSVRTDVTPAGGLKPVWTYRDAHLDGFPRFMEDRAAVERWKQTLALYFGEVEGDPTPGFLGLHPGR